MHRLSFLLVLRRFLVASYAVRFHYYKGDVVGRPVKLKSHASKSEPTMKLKNDATIRFSFPYISTRAPAP